MARAFLHQKGGQCQNDLNKNYDVPLRNISDWNQDSPLKTHSNFFFLFAIEIKTPHIEFC